MSKRVLIISYYWPPTGGSGVQRWVKFCKYLPEFGWVPVVYTPENPEQLAVDESLLKDVPSGVTVLKTRIFEPYELYRRLRGKKAGEVNPLNAQKKSFVQRLMVAVRGNFFIPDPRVLWVRPSVDFLLKYILENPVDAVVTTGPPQSMHLIGRDLMRALRKKGCSELPRWIADFRDPWTDMFYFKHMGLWKCSERKHHRLEQSVLDECDCIVAVSPLVQADFASKTSTPVELVTNGFDEDDFPSVISDFDVAELEGKFVIAHTGLFAGDGNPIALWKQLSERCQRDDGFRVSLRIVLAGKTDSDVISSLFTFGLCDNVIDMDYLPHDRIVSLQRRAEILILPLRREPEYLKVLPGKIFEYVASGRPVLGIGQENGAAAKLLEKYRAGRMFDWESGARQGEFVDSVYSAFTRGERCQNNPSDIRKLSRKYLTKMMSDLL